MLLSRSQKVSSGYQPLSIAPSGWLKTSDTSTMYQSGTRGAPGTATAVGDPVGLILDQSGNNIDFTQSTSTARPILRDGGWLEFDGTDDYLQNLAPGIAAGGYPISFGFWFSSDGAVDDVLFALTDTGVADPGSRLVSTVQGTSKLTLNARGAAAPQNGQNTTKSVIAGGAHYAVFRAISATNRRLSVLFSDGVIEHTQSTTSTTLASLDAAFVGGYRHSAATLFGPMDGKIKELWWKNADIQPGGAQLADATLLQLAYGGIAL